MTYDTIIQGGTLVRYDGRRVATIAITDGVITGFYEPGTDVDADRTIDATGRYVLPGGVDPHVHMMDPGDTHLEDFMSGTAAAAAGGVTTIGDQHRHPPEGVLNPEVFERKRKHLADRARIDFGLMAGGHPENIDEIAALESAGAFGYKSFTCEAYGVPALLSDHMLDLYHELASVGGISMVHPEDERILKANKERLDNEGRTDADAILEWHSKAAEQVACATTIQIGTHTGAPFWLAHLSHPEVVDMVSHAKSIGVDAYAESCVRYLYMTEADVLERAPWVSYTPPPRSPADREGMWDRLAEGAIDMINADHVAAPPRSDIEPYEGGNLLEAPGHNASVELVLPLLLNGVADGRISLERVVEVFSTNPAKIIGLYPEKGGIRLGSDADLVIVDLKQEWTIRDEDIVAKCGWTPYDSVTVQGVVDTTLVRGEPVFEGGDVVMEPGYGEFVVPDRSRTPWTRDLTV